MQLQYNQGYDKKAKEEQSATSRNNKQFDVGI